MTTERIVKVFAGASDQDILADTYQQIERYDSFILLTIPSSSLKRLAKQFLTEDITDTYAIKINGTVLAKPPVGKSSNTKARSRAGIVAPTSGNHHFLVQFIGPIKDEWLKAITKTGGKLREPLNELVYIVRANQKVANAICKLPFVRWVGHYAHSDRIAESVVASLSANGSASAHELPRRKVMTDVLLLTFFGTPEAKAAVKTIKQLGAELLSADTKAAVATVRIIGNAKQKKKQVAQLSAIHGVRRIRQKTLRRTTNDVAATIMNTVKSTSLTGLKLAGEGEIIAVCDTGIDSGIAATVHEDFAGRIVEIKSYPITPALDSYINNPRANDGAADVDSGHGTHVAGSVLGNGTAAGLLPGSPAIRGLSWKARLVFQAVEQETKWKSPIDARENGRFGLWGLPDNLGTLFQFAYDKGARIHTNSWGGGDAGAYDVQCRQVDQFVWDHKDFCVLFAAGNDGTDADGDGRINPGSVTSPGTSKNCITVGACENLRTNFNSQTYGAWWPKDYPASPIKNDPIANNPDQLAAFSSRGPTLDKRIKPEIVAPGTFILSTRSTQIGSNNFAWGAYPPSKKYFHMGGTSMATPLAAGAVGLVREFLRKKKGIPVPSAALLKATLIAGASRLPIAGASNSICDNHQGFGRINLDNVLSPSAPTKAIFQDIRQGLTTGASWTQSIPVATSGTPLRITLAYSDYPGSNLINNLNLIVRSPNGSVFVGNQTPGGPLTLDTRNNVEVVQINSAAAGNWRIEVVASSVPRGPQDFAVVVLGAV